MKRSIQEIELRRKKIIAFLEKSYDYKKIANLLDISLVTLRRDLAALEQMGKIFRQRGCAIVQDYLKIDENPIKEIEIIKDKLGKAAANLVQDNSTVFINSGSTPLYAIKHLKNKRNIIISNNIKAATVKLNKESKLILSGGEVRFPKESLIGDFAIEFFNSAIADVTIIGIHGISSVSGITSPNLAEARINDKIISRTNGLVIVVADYRKIGLVSTFKSGELSRIDYLITDINADQNLVREFEKFGITTIQVPV